MKTLEAVDKYLRGKTVSRNTELMFRRAFVLLNEFEPELPMSRMMLNEWLVWLSKRYPHLRDVSRATYLRFVRTVYRYLAKIYEWEKNPIDGVESIKVIPRKRRIFNPDELSKIFKACRTEYEKVLVGVLLDSSCRIHELAGLPVENVGENSFKCLANTKTGEHIYRCRPEICRVMRRMAVNGFVFTRSNGLPVSSKVLTNKVCLLVKRAGIKGDKLGAHTFRHTAATLVAEASGSVLVVQSVTGHKSIDMAMTYSPLELAGQMMMEMNDDNVSQVHLLTDGQGKDIENKKTALVVDEKGEVVNKGSDDWHEEMFRKVPAGAEVRPLLKEADLEIIRYAFLLVVEYGQWVGSDSTVRNLWQRILRKVK